jgi:hypothetical protein
MILPNVGDKIYIIQLRKKEYQIGIIKEIEDVDDCIGLLVDWIINPLASRYLSYFKYRFHDLRFMFGDDVIVSFKEEYFIEDLKKIC